MSTIAPTWFQSSARPFARRFISLYSPETPLNRYLEHIRRIYTAPRTHPRRRATRPISLQPPPPPTPIIRPRHLSRLYLRVARTKSQVASTRRSSPSKSSRRRAVGRTGPPSSFPSPLPPLFYCRCARRDKFPRIYRPVEKRETSAREYYSRHAAVIPPCSAPRFAVGIADGRI